MSAETKVNYIKHLNAVNQRFFEEASLNASHISMYNALFQLWNGCGFQNDLSINRNDVMKLSKIGSVNTYLKVLKELDGLGFIKYKPSHNPLKGSIVNLFRFDTSSDIVVNKYCTSSGTSSDTLYKLLNKETIKLLNNNYVLVNENIKSWIDSSTADEVTEGEGEKITFNDFWNLYSKKVGGKKKPQKKWNSLPLTTQQKIMDTLPNFLAGIKDKQYQPYPMTYLNDDRWEDESEEVKPMEVEVNGKMRKVKFYKDDGTPVFEPNVSGTLEDITKLETAGRGF